MIYPCKTATEQMCNETDPTYLDEIQNPLKRMKSVKTLIIQVQSKNVLCFSMMQCSSVQNYTVEGSKIQFQNERKSIDILMFLLPSDLLFESQATAHCKLHLVHLTLHTLFCTFHTIHYILRHFKCWVYCAVKISVLTICHETALKT